MGLPVEPPSGPSPYITKAAYSRGTAAWSNSNAPGNVVVWAPQEGGFVSMEEVTLARNGSVGGSAVSALAFSGDGRRLAVATRTDYNLLSTASARSSYPKLHLFDQHANPFNLTRLLQHRFSTDIISMDFEPGLGTSFAATSEFPRCAPWLFDLETRSKASISKQAWNSLSGPHDVALKVRHRSSTTLIFGLRSGGVVLCDKRGGAAMALYKPGKKTGGGGKGWSSSFHFVNENVVIAGCCFGGCRLYDVRRRGVVANFDVGDAGLSMNDGFALGSRCEGVTATADGGTVVAPYVKMVKDKNSSDGSQIIKRMGVWSYDGGSKGELVAEDCVKAQLSVDPSPSSHLANKSAILAADNNVGDSASDLALDFFCSSGGTPLRFRSTC